MNKKTAKRTRSIFVLLVAWGFLVIVATGVVLFITPHGRVAYWVDWEFLGLSVDHWADLHIVFSALLLIAVPVHLFFNWKPFKNYLAERVAGHLHPRLELVATGTLAAVVLVAALWPVAPASYLLDLNAMAKDAWVTDQAYEPPFGHAEELSFAGLMRRQGIEIDEAQAILTAANVSLPDTRAKFEDIAHANGVSPMQLYALIQHLEVNPEVPTGAELTPEEIDARFGGTGIGRKTLSVMAEEVGMDVAAAQSRLAAAGIAAEPDETMKAIGDRHDAAAIAMLKVMLIEGYRPE